MKRLCLLRHAKSSWTDRSLSDIERPLKGRGKRDCKLVGAALKDLDDPFANVFCSPAKRARMTIERVLKSADVDAHEWEVDERLYTFDVYRILSWLRKTHDDLDQIMIVGHNPAFTDLSNELADDELENLPTCGFAELYCNVERWRDIAPGCAELVTLLTPKMLREKKPTDDKGWFR